MKAMDVLKRPAGLVEKPRPAVEPPRIPPQIPVPKTGEYAKLMKKHDRMNTRHVREK